MDILLLRLDAPLMSFGAPIVDRHGVIQPYPALSMITGLLANALGYEHYDFDRLERLQERLRYAVREDRAGRRVQDYQTVDLSQPHMQGERAWTTAGTLEGRAGGSASTGTHIRLRDYWADAAYTLALRLEAPDEAPTVDDLAEAVRHPARPLFIGRKTCLPAAPVFLGCAEAAGLREALAEAPLAAGAAGPAMKGTKRRAWWPSHPGAEKRAGEATRRPVTDRRDWRNQIHVGERWIAYGKIEVTPEHGNTAPDA